MALESATYISDLNSSNPAASDAISTADDHLRLIKSTIKATFPNVTGAVTKTHTEINGLAPLASPTFTGTPAAPTASAGTNTTQLATTAFVQAAKTALLDSIYPVGSIYTNATSSTNPATLLGFGTWSAFGAGRVMVGFNGSDPLFDTAEETGGSKDAVTVSHTHTGTTASNGAHEHETRTGSYTGMSVVSGTSILLIDKDATSYGDPLASNVMTTAGAHTHTFTTDSTGSSGTNANLQPYITVYMWKRTA